MRDLIVLLVLAFGVQINAQGEQCITPYDVVGVCVIRGQCHSPLDLFYFDFVLFKNDLCSRSERFSNGRRFVCCTHPIVNVRPPIGPNGYPGIPPEVPPFGLPRTTPLSAAQTLPQTAPPESTSPNAPSTTTTSTTVDPVSQSTETTPQLPPDPLAPTTPQMPPQSSSESGLQTTTPLTPTSNTSVPGSGSGSMSCFDPSGVEGFCCNLTDCPFINIEYQTKRFFFTYEDQYKVYIQQSTQICIAHSDDSICCPNRRTTTEAPTSTTTTTTQPPEPNIPFGRLLTPLEGCGYSNVTHKRIADGNIAEPGSFPWIALLTYTNSTGDLSFRCAGSLITSRHVLTAAHCVTPTVTSVRLGVYDITSTNDETIQDVNVIRAERHPDYDFRYGINDIAILYLERDVDATPEIRPICLPINETLRMRSFIGYLPFIAGWDLAREDGNSSTLQKEMQVPVLDNVECREQYQRQNRIMSENQFGDDVICTSAYISGNDKCVSDSGSPLMMPIYDRDTHDDRYYQIGIITREIGCDQEETLDIYARVQIFIEWIQERIAQ